MRNDLAGKRFGKLVAIRRIPGNETKRATWECRCDCGALSYPVSVNLKSGHSTSCGCHGRSVNARHRQSNKPIYLVWRNMIARCTKPKHPQFERYGSRGITVCQEWMVFDNFFRDMGSPPFPRCTLDRVDNDRGYEPKNCRWATYGEQLRNTSKTVYYEVNGVRLCQTDWAKRIGISDAALRQRLEKWPLERALTTPANDAYRRPQKKRA